MKFVSKLLFVKRSIFSNIRPSGQISKKSELGKWIQFLSSLSDVLTIVEIGTWNGRGSTRLICLGVCVKPAQLQDRVQVHGYEINPIMYKNALPMARKYKFLHLHLGSIVDVSNLDSENLSAEEDSWYEADKKSIAQSPNVLDSVPNQIDLLLLDGGEFSTYAEFLLLQPRVSKWLLLDDTKVRKGFKIVELLKEQTDFHLVYESDERNGVAIFRRYTQLG